MPKAISIIMFGKNIFWLANDKIKLVLKLLCLKIKSKRC